MFYRCFRCVLVIVTVATLGEAAADCIHRGCPDTTTDERMGAGSLAGKKQRLSIDPFLDGSDVAEEGRMAAGTSAKCSVVSVMDFGTSPEMQATLEVAAQSMPLGGVGPLDERCHDPIVTQAQIWRCLNATQSGSSNGAVGTRIREVALTALSLCAEPEATWQRRVRSCTGLDMPPLLYRTQASGTAIRTHTLFCLLMAECPIQRARRTCDIVVERLSRFMHACNDVDDSFTTVVDNCISRWNIPRYSLPSVTDGRRRAAAVAMALQKPGDIIHELARDDIRARKLIQWAEDELAALGIGNIDQPQLHATDDDGQSVAARVTMQLQLAQLVQKYNRNEHGEVEVVEKLANRTTVSSDGDHRSGGHEDTTSARGTSGREEDKDDHHRRRRLFSM